MDGNSSSGENCNISLDTDDERETKNLPLSARAVFPIFKINAGSGERLLSSTCARGKEDYGMIRDTVLFLQAPKTSPEQHPCVDFDQWSDEDDLSDADNWSGSASDISVIFLPAPTNSSSEAKISALESMGPEASISELKEFTTAVQMAKAGGVSFQELSGESKPNDPDRKRKHRLKEGKQGTHLAESNQTILFPEEMVGFGVPTKEGSSVIHRNLPELVAGPPYFYYENVALAPAGVWDTISRFLYDIQPEFVDSKYFSAATRKRGYVHNLPIDKRFPLVLLPPQTIQEAFPFTKRWWPSWDTRTKLNCLNTCTGSAKVIGRITEVLNKYEMEPPESVKKYIMKECEEWNLIWVGKNMVAPLECGDMETLLGFPTNHTRGAGSDRTCIYTSPGNLFQVDTVAYHLSVLKDLFPGGINVLSLFSGIGGAEVALHRLEIPMKNVVSVEISEVNRLIVKRWWEQTNQKGKLIQVADISEVTFSELQQWMSSFGGFDLVIGSSPCNTLTGCNRWRRYGLEGDHSSLFYEYARILDNVRLIMK